MITQQILWRKGTVMIFMRVNGDDCYRGRNLWGHLLPPTYIFLYWQIISYCGERFPFNFFLKVSRWYSSQFAADPPFVSSWSVLFLLRPSASLPSFSVSQRGSGTQGHQGGSYEDESLMEEQQRQIPGENFSRVSRFLSVNWRGRAEAVFMDGSWLTTDALTILLYCAIPNHTYHTFCLTIQCHPLLYITIRKHRPATDALPAAGSSSSQPTLIDSIKLPCGEIWILLKATRIQSRWAQHSISVEIITLPSHAVAQILLGFCDIFRPHSVGGKHKG